MAKRRLNPDEIRAAVEAGPPPHSVNYETDKKWHAEQNRWLAKWTERRLPPDSGDSGSSRRDQWRDRKQQHARLLRAAEKEPSASLKRQRKAAATPAVTHSDRVHAGPPRLKRPKPPPEGGDQQAYELAMGMYGIARDTRRKMSRRTKSEDAERKRDARAITAMMARPQAVKAAKERMERERERSQRRRDVAKLTVTSYYEERMRIRRLDEQVALLKAVDEALRDSDYWRTTGFFSS
ncbi:hypothetical protein EMIHUDRAFT_124231, partial [Emiliania huxleyi CCMP1516]|uniref:Uncharacterized protein n=2 Tax=Emiliania huxleyi TaxID=2903 RepID=A0A0D3IY29_EMIH1